MQVRCMSRHPQPHDEACWERHRLSDAAVIHRGAYAIYNRVYDIGLPRPAGSGGRHPAWWGPATKDFFLPCHRVQHDEEDGSRYRAVALAHKAHGGHNGDGYE